MTTTEYTCYYENSEFNIIEDRQYEKKFRLLSVSKIVMPYNSFYFIIKAIDNDTGKIWEKIINVDSQITCCENYNFETEICNEEPNIPVVITSSQSDEYEKFIPQIYIPGDNDKIYIFDNDAHMKIKYAELKHGIGEAGGYVLFEIINEENVVLWSLVVYNYHNGYYTHSVSVTETTDKKNQTVLIDNYVI